MPAIHAPPGGINIKGHFFRGGAFIPKSYQQAMQQPEQQAEPEQEIEQEAWATPEEIKSETTEVDPNAVKSMYEANRARSVELAAAMKESGWEGSPILVMQDGELVGVTGENRIEAAKEIGMPKVPAVLFEWKRMDKIITAFGLWDDMLAELEDEDLYLLLKKLPKDDTLNRVCLELLRQEILHNREEESRHAEHPEDSEATGAVS